MWQVAFQHNSCLYMTLLFAEKIYRYRCFTGIFCLILFTSCGSNHNKRFVDFASANDSCIILKLDDSENKSELRLSSIFSSALLIPLETRDDILLGKINSMQVVGDRLFILDKHIAKGLFVFDLKGVFLYKIGSIGSGPGEFTAISDFTIDTDKGVVYTLDNNTQIVHAYQLQNGSYIGNLHIGHEGIVSFNIQYCDSVLFTDIYQNNKRHLLRSINIETGDTEKFFMDVEAYNIGFNDMTFTGNGVFFSRNLKPIFMQMYMDTIINLSNHEIQNHAVLETDFFVKKRDLHNSSTPFKTLLQLNKFHTLESYVETDGFILIKGYYKNFVRYFFYDKRMKETLIYNLLADDIVFMNFDPGKTKIRPKLLCETDKGVYGYFPEISSVLDEINKGNISNGIPSTLPFALIKEDSNPIVIFYECK